jgi:hypothetical protein
VLEPLGQVESAFPESAGPDSDDFSANESDPIPLGFDHETWREYLLDRVASGHAVDAGGVQIVVARMDRPLVYDGEHRVVELVPVSSGDLDRLGVSPGDECPDSAPLVRRVCVRAPDDGDDGGTQVGPDTGPSRGFPGNPTGNPDTWDSKTGSGLAFGTDSLIEIRGCSGSLWPLVLSSADRRGEACFFSYYTQENGCAELLYPWFPCPIHLTRTTYYAKMIDQTFEIGGWFFHIFLWLVYEPELWMTVGEDGWDNISLFGDKEAADHRLVLQRVRVKHNGKWITADAALESPNSIGAPPDSRNLQGEIWDCQHALTFYSDSAIVKRAVEDYAQAASTKYPVFPSSQTWNGITLPRNWCTEFASWAIRQGTQDMGYQEAFPGLPQAQPGDQDIGVLEMLFWAANYDQDRIRFFGQNSSYYQQNGPTDLEWAELATGVKPGDYAARAHEVLNEMNFAEINGHSMVVVGWLADDGSEVGGEHFDSSRRCNRLLTVGGNEGGIGSATLGLGSIVNVGPKVVCRPAKGDDGASVEPDCDIDGDGIPNESGSTATGQPEERCSIRLWDTVLPPQSQMNRAGFFIDLQVGE